MKPVTKPILAALVATAFAAPAALAFDTDEATFQSMDTNGDAVVTESEYVTHAAAHEGMDPEGAKLRFEVLAGDDGQLTEAEFKQAMDVLIQDDMQTAPGETMPGPGET